MLVLKRKINRNIKMKELFSKLEIEESENAIKNVPFHLKVKTPYGFEQIASAFRTEKQMSIKSSFANGKELITSDKHLLKVDGEWKRVSDIIEDLDVVETEHGTTSIKSKKVIGNESLYDISVEKVHCYYSNGILSHNSWCLCKIGAEALRRGKNVLHITLELNEAYVGLRYDAVFTKIDFQDIREHKELVKNKMTEIEGKLVIKYYPTKTIPAMTIKNHVERLSMLGKKVDLLVVDYADILRPLESPRNSNSYQDAGSIYEELRAVAGELQIPIWSASQVTRSGAREDVIEAHHMADSYRKVMTADVVISVSRKVEDKKLGTARFHVMKNRFGADGITFPSKMNTSNGDIEVYDPNTQDGAKIQNLMDAASGQEELQVKQKLVSRMRELVAEEPRNVV
jgi:hypothetical protein